MPTHQYPLLQIRFGRLDAIAAGHSSRSKCEKFDVFDLALLRNSGQNPVRSSISRLDYICLGATYILAI